MQGYVKLPDAIWQYRLSSTELMVYTALRRYINPFGRCIVKHQTIGQLVGCSTATVSRTTRQLSLAGLLTIHECRNKATGDRIANGYTLELLQGGYTKIPTSIFAYKLPKSDFKVYVYLLKCRAKKGLQAVPSLSQMVSILNMSKRTVIDAVRHLNSAFLVLKETYYRRRDNRLGHNRHTVLSPLLRLLVLLLALRQHRDKQSGGRPLRKAARQVLELYKTFKSILHKSIQYFKGLEQKPVPYFLI